MIELNEPEAIKSLVGSGLGISFMSRLRIQGSIDAGHLVKLRVTGFSLKRALDYAVHANKHLTPSMRTFVDSVRDRYEA
jgi:DNA-binding transcriptional LysR family regulator